ncbi:MAG: hydroxyacylglutathione hydrolase [Pseudomonadota bacterium]
MILQQKPEVICIPAFHDNYIWLVRQGSAVLVVDPGAAAPVLAMLAQQSWSLQAILLTHHHADHQGGVAELLAHHPAPVYGPGAESITRLSHPLYGGEVIDFAALAFQLRVIAVPGHTLGHLAYYGFASLFCGDTLFGGGCGRLFEGTPQQMANSLAQLAALPDETAVYCAHEYTAANLRFALAVEPDNLRLQQRIADLAALSSGQQTKSGLARGCSLPSSIALEKQSNPFLRCHLAHVALAVQRSELAGLAPAEVNDPLAVFAALRRWKDVFK